MQADVDAQYILNHKRLNYYYEPRIDLIFIGMGNAIRFAILT